ncbi:MAG: ankyrin repeat domain-containing protein [Nitrospiraceae bacterium]
MKTEAGVWLIGMVLLASASSSNAQSSLQLGHAQADLEKAINNLDVSAVREAIRTGADPNYRYGGYGRSVLAMVGVRQLLFLARHEQVTTETEERIVAIYDVLFELGARLAAYDRDILHHSSIGGAPHVAKYLLERGANPNGADSGGNTPVILATKYGHPEVVTALVAGGATPLDSDTSAQIRMISAVGRDDLIAFQRELMQGSNVNSRDLTGRTALLEAVTAGNSSMVLELLKLGADPNKSGHFYARPYATSTYATPLHAAVCKDERSFKFNGSVIVDALLKGGAHVSSTTFHRKQTPLHVAVRMQNTKAAMLLLKASAKVMPHDEDGKTPLDLAESSAMIELLKAHGAREQ